MEPDATVGQVGRLVATIERGFEHVLEVVIPFATSIVGGADKQVFGTGFGFCLRVSVGIPIPIPIRAVAVAVAVCVFVLIFVLFFRVLLLLPTTAIPISGLVGGCERPSVLAHLGS